MAISLTSSLLLVGTSTGIINIYDVPSHQLLRSINSHKGNNITHLTTMLKPPDLIGHITLGMNVNADKDINFPIIPVTPFQRMRDGKTRDAHEVMMVLPARKKV